MRHSDTWLEWFALIVKAAELEAQGAVVEARRLLAAASELRQGLEVDDETPRTPAERLAAGELQREELETEVEKSERSKTGISWSQPFQPVCPRCGDLCARNATRCRSCGAPLTLARRTRASRRRSGSRAGP